jgi:hypothetical protein
MARSTSDNGPFITASAMSLHAVGSSLGITSVGRSRRGQARAVYSARQPAPAVAIHAAVTKVLSVGSAPGHCSPTGCVRPDRVGLRRVRNRARRWQTGALAPAMAANNASTLVFRLVFGVATFEETIAPPDNGGAVPAWLDWRSQSSRRRTGKIRHGFVWRRATRARNHPGVPGSQSTKAGGTGRPAAGEQTLGGARGAVIPRARTARDSSSGASMPWVPVLWARRPIHDRARLPISTRIRTRPIRRGY